MNRKRIIFCVRLIVLEIILVALWFYLNSLNTYTDSLQIFLNNHQSIAKVVVLIIFPGFFLLSFLLLFISSIILIVKKSTLAGILILLWVLGVVLFAGLTILGSFDEPRKSDQSIALAKLANIRPQIETIFESKSPQSYYGICNENDVSNTINAIINTKAIDGPVKCFDDNDSYVIAFKYKYKNARDAQYKKVFSCASYNDNNYMFEGYYAQDGFMYDSIMGPNTSCPNPTK